MVIVLFRTKLREGADRKAYGELAGQLLGIAEAMPGFVSFDSYRNRDDETLSVVVFESDEAREAWRVQPDHLEAQRRGREEFYESYSFEVTTLEHGRTWDHGGSS